MRPRKAQGYAEPWIHRRSDQSDISSDLRTAKQTSGSSTTAFSLHELLHRRDVHDWMTTVGILNLQKIKEPVTRRVHADDFASHLVQRCFHGLSAI
jgi:hypothetical protein